MVSNGVTGSVSLAKGEEKSKKGEEKPKLKNSEVVK
jgi:hypothetical protein